MVNHVDSHMLLQQEGEGVTYIVVSKQVVADQPLHLGSSPASGIKYDTVAFCHFPDLAQGQTTLVVPARHALKNNGQWCGD